MPNDRRALIVAGAGGPEEAINAVLARFEFRAAERASALAEAVPRLRGEHFDIVIVAFDRLSDADVALLEREIRREGSAFVIGMAPEAKPDTVLRALRAGVHEFVTSPPTATELSAAVDRLTRRRSATTRSGLTISTYSAKGGLGVTSLAVNVGYALSHVQQGSRVVIADFVMVGGDVRVMLDLKPTYDVGDLAMKVDRLDSDLLLSLLTQHDGGVWALPSSDNPEVQDLIDAGTAATILGQLRTHFSYVVVDAEHALTERTLAALDASDRILLVTQLTVPALRSAQRTLQLFDRLHFGRQKVHVVANRFDAAEGIAMGDAEDVLGREIFWKLPNDYRDSSEALTRGVPVVQYAPDSVLGRSYRELAARITGAATVPDGGNGAAAQPGASRFGRLLRMRKK